jgi:hypothetical protein
MASSLLISAATSAVKPSSISASVRWCARIVVVSAWTLASVGVSLVVDGLVVVIVSSSRCRTSFAVALHSLSLLIRWSRALTWQFRRSYAVAWGQHSGISPTTLVLGA